MAVRKADAVHAFMGLMAVALNPGCVSVPRGCLAMPAVAFGCHTWEWGGTLLAAVSRGQGLLSSLSFSAIPPKQRLIQSQMLTELLEESTGASGRPAAVCCLKRYLCVSREISRCVCGWRRVCACVCVCLTGREGRPRGVSQAGCEWQSREAGSRVPTWGPSWRQRGGGSQAGGACRLC